MSTHAVAAELLKLQILTLAKGAAATRQSGLPDVLAVDRSCRADTHTGGRPDLQWQQVGWGGGDTFIQKDGINQDFGVFDSPDEFYVRHGTNLKGVKRWLFQHVIRRKMNGNVARIRQGATTRIASGGPVGAIPTGKDQPDSGDASR